MLHKRYEEELKKQETLLCRKNEADPDFYNGVYDRYRYPVLTREHIPLTWQYDLNPQTNPYFMKRKVTTEWRAFVSGTIPSCFRTPARRRRMFTICG